MEGVQTGNDGYLETLCLVGFQGVIRLVGHAVLKGAPFSKLDTRAASVKELTGQGQAVYSGGLMVQAVGQFADFLGDVNGIGGCLFQRTQIFREQLQLLGGKRA